MTHFLSFVYLLKSYHQLNHHHHNPPSCIICIMLIIIKNGCCTYQITTATTRHNHTACHCRKSDTDKSYEWNAFFLQHLFRHKKNCHDMLKSCIVVFMIWWHIRRKKWNSHIIYATHCPQNYFCLISLLLLY